jgi:hypothetical protein
MLPRLFRDDVNATLDGEDCSTSQNKTYELKKSHLYVPMPCSLFAWQQAHNFYVTYLSIFCDKYFQWSDQQ